ncbi:PAAR domain-containing protein [Burkholderia sp. AU45274]|uniref:PAAR domain-containing protein n=1 Tax=Burkholderia sp. AU45274 TaxID=3059205 RepID=UPI0026505136|nr:PAAR domain-containing protein [Burkholderia sp. AU45274]MDN7492547.1 PAAR domain-containing protein [Burkholderia sp. AU45274]
MSSAFIREGDTTDHGGRVLACTSTNIVFGKPLALEGDMVSCLKGGGVYWVELHKMPKLLSLHDSAAIAQDRETAPATAGFVAPVVDLPAMLALRIVITHKTDHFDGHHLSEPLARRGDLRTSMGTHACRDAARVGC